MAEIDKIFFDGHPIIVELTPPGYGEGTSNVSDFYEAVSMDSLAPLEVLDLDGSAESFLEWTMKYGIPNVTNRRATPYTLAESGEKIYNLATMRKLQSDFKDIATAVNLWQWIGEKNIASIRDFLSLQNHLLTWKFLDGPLFGWRNCTLPNEWLADLEGFSRAFREDDAVTLQGAAVVLGYITNQGLKHFHPVPQIEVDIEANPVLIKNGIPSVNNPLAYIWDVICRGISGKGVHTWPYRRCVDCGKWADLSQPGRNKNWTRCDACTKKRRTAKNVAYKQTSREKQRVSAGLPKRTRGRPGAKGD
ncbi:MAG: hypothetical protein LBO68_03515 [Synergistaceae bacterium]|nr:hypothetical protein [Synergistaceae bacterium]